MRLHILALRLLLMPLQSKLGTAQSLANFFRGI